MKAVKVVRIIARLNVGGPALHCLLLARDLEARGFRTTLVTGRLAEGEESFESLFQDAASAPKIVRLGRLRRLPSVIGDLQSLAELITIIRRERPDIVHTHTAKAGVLGRLAALVCGVPVIVHTFHGHVLHGYFSKTVSAAVRLVERSLARLSSAVITLSPALRDELAGYGIGPKRRLRVIPLGRDLDRFHKTPRQQGRLRQELGLNAQTPLIGCVGRLVPIKDHDTLLRAFAALEKERRGRLVIVGDGELASALKARARELGIAEETSFLGWRSDLAAIYSDLDVLALASRNEGTPLSIIEAFAAGCPVVATGVGGVPDLIPAGENAPGLIVPPDRPAELAAALARVLDDPDLRANMSRAAREASQRFTGERLADAIAGLYRELLRGRP